MKSQFDSSTSSFMWIGRRRDAALGAFAISPFIGEYLGEDFRQALTEIKRVEQAEFAAAVSPLEYDSYPVLS